MNNADTVYNTLKRCLKKKCHEYIYVHDLDFSLKREREGGGRVRERELPSLPMLFVSMHLSMCL